MQIAVVWEDLHHLLELDQEVADQTSFGLII